MIEKKLSFQADFDILEEKKIEDTRFAKVKIWLMYLGHNKAKNMNFLKPVVDRAIPTLSNIPILSNVEYNRYNAKDDFTHHEVVTNAEGERVKKTVAIGVIPETNNAKYEEREVNGETKTFLTVEGLLWNEYAKDEVSIFKRDNGVKSQSMELTPSLEAVVGEDGIIYVVSMSFLGACVLGDHIEPAMEGSTIELFSKDATALNAVAKEIQNKITMYSNGEGGKDLNKEKDTKKILDNKETKTTKENKEIIEPKKEKEKAVLENKDDKKEKVVKTDKASDKDDKADKVDKTSDKIDKPVKKKEEEKKEKETENSQDTSKPSKEGLEPSREKMPCDFQAEIADLKKELEELRNFKKDIIEQEEKRKKETIFNKYNSISGLSEYKEIKEKANEFTADELDRELALVFANNADKINFSNNTREDKGSTYLFSDMLGRKSTKDEKYGELLKKYGYSN